jgi:hypothetical protein
MMVKNKILVVTGMHRSGTSVITQWLNKCGLHVGDNLMGAGTGNDDGHYEDLDFLHAHQAILKGRRLADKGYTQPIKRLREEEEDRLKDIVSYKNNFNREWGWKDPRTCLFLDTYRQLIPGAFYFVVLRDYQSVVSSLIIRMYKHAVKKYSSRKGLSKFIWEHFKKKRRMRILLKKHCQSCLQVWIDYNEAILQHLQQLPPDNYIVADYSILYDNDKIVFDHLTHEWGFTLNYFNFKNIYKDNLLHTALDINTYVKDKSLFSRAAGIEASLRLISISNNRAHALLAV